MSGICVLSVWMVHEQMCLGDRFSSLQSAAQNNNDTITTRKQRSKTGQNCVGTKGPFYS